MTHTQLDKWEALGAAEQAALASASFEDNRRWLISTEFEVVGAVLSEQGLTKRYGNRWALTPTGHTVRAFRTRQR